MYADAVGLTVCKDCPRGFVANNTGRSCVGVAECCIRCADDRRNPPAPQCQQKDETGVAETTPPPIVATTSAAPTTVAITQAVETTREREETTSATVTTTPPPVLSLCGNGRRDELDVQGQGGCWTDAFGGLVSATSGTRMQACADATLLKDVVLAELSGGGDGRFHMPEEVRTPSSLVATP